MSRRVEVVSLINIGLNTAINLNVEYYYLEIENRCEFKDVWRHIDLMWDYIEIIQKGEEGVIVIPTGNRFNYRCELVIKYENIAGYLYYERILVEDGKVSVLNRDEGRPSFSLDNLKVVKSKKISKLFRLSNVTDY